MVARPSPTDPHATAFGILNSVQDAMAPRVRDRGHPLERDRPAGAVLAWRRCSAAVMLLLTMVRPDAKER